MEINWNAINCKIELNLKWTKYCALSEAGADSVNANYNNNFTMKDTKLYVPVVNLLVKEDQFIEMNIKENLRIKLRQMNLDIFSNQILLELLD